MNYEEEYHKHTNLLRKVVWLFMKHNGLPRRDYEEWRSQANLYFMIACHSYTGSKGKLSTWLTIQVMGRLRKELSNQEFYATKNHSVSDFTSSAEYDELLLKKTRTETNQKDWKNWPEQDFLDELSPEGHELLAMVKSGVLDLQRLFKGRRLGIKPVFLFLRERGWSRVKIHRSFKSVHKLIEK